MFYQLIFLIFFLILVLDRWKPYRLVKLHNQLGCNSIYLPIIGNALRFLGNNEEKMIVINDGAVQSYKNKHGSISYWLGNTLMVEISDPQQASVILKNSLDKKYVRKFAKHLTGEGIIFASLPEWIRRRKIILQIFTKPNINKFLSFFDENSNILLEEIDKKVIEDHNLSYSDEIYTFSFKSLFLTSLGVTSNTQIQRRKQFFEAFFEYSDITINRFLRPWLHNEEIHSLLPSYAKQEELKRIIHNFIDCIIQNKKSLMESSTDNKSDNRVKIFLELMIERSKFNKEGYSNEELREELLVLIVAGTDTSATGILFVMLILSQYPDVQERVYQEIKEVIGDSESSITCENLNKLKYLDAVIKETLRLYPPVTMILRQCCKDTEMRYYYASLSMKVALLKIVGRYRLLPATSFQYDRHNPLRLSYKIMLKHVHNFEIQIKRRN